MKKHPIPEILRVPLESILLRAKIAREDEDPKVRLILWLGLLQSFDRFHVALLEQGIESPEPRCD
jgi:hypothetical protein